MNYIVDINTMKQFSTRAEKYITKLKKSKEWTCDKETVIEYFESQEFSVFKPLVRFQVRYSGLELSIDDNEEEMFSLRLFSNEEIKDKEPLDYFEENGNYWFDCGIHARAQFNFYINQIGEVCAESGGDINIIYSSIEMMIEKYALIDSLSNWHKDVYYYNIQNVEKFNTLVVQEKFRPIQECCDEYLKCITNGSVTIIQGTWLDKPEFYLHIYSDNEVKTKQFVERLKKEKIL